MIIDMTDNASIMLILITTTLVFVETQSIKAISMLGSLNLIATEYYF